MIDDIDLKIMKIMGEQGRESILTLSSQLGLPNSTGRQGIKRLMDKGIIHVNCVVDPDFFSHVFIIVVGVITTEKRKDQLNELYRIPNVVCASSVTGRYDYLVTFMATSREMVAETIDNRIYGIQGVSHTESFIILEDRGLLVNSDKFSALYREDLAQNEKSKDRKKILK